MKLIPILQDLEERLRCVEGYTEGLLAQQREWLTRLESVDTRLEAIESHIALIQARLTGRESTLIADLHISTAHTQRLVREKDQLAAALGRIIYAKHMAEEITR